MKIFVIGKRNSGKTPFCNAVTKTTGWQHIEALKWLMCHFEEGEFAMMILDPEEMNSIVLGELTARPRACAHYVDAQLAGNTQPVIIDGLFALDDFKQFFDPATDLVVDLMPNHRVHATSYEQGLNLIRDYLHQCAIDGTFDENRLYRYRFAQFHRDKSAGDEVTLGAKHTLYCSSLAAAIDHFAREAKKVASAA